MQWKRSLDGLKYREYRQTDRQTQGRRNVEGNEQKKNLAKICIIDVFNCIFSIRY